MKIELSPKEARRILNNRANAARKKRAPKPKPPKRDNPKADRGRIRDNAYLAYLRRQPCEACGSVHRIEAAHIRSSYPEPGWSHTGMQVKPSDFRALSLCRLCHQDGPDAQHKSNERAWWQARGIYPPGRCAEVYADFEAGRNQSEKSDISA